MVRVLGIDPGLRLTGYGCIEPLARAQAAPGRSPVRVIEAGVFRLDAKSTVSDRLQELRRDFVDLLSRCEPQIVAVEALYAHYAHPATAIVMGHARGVILLSVREAGLKLVELRPAEVKKSATGYGQAVKEQVQRAMQAELGLAELPRPPDVADALAIALCAWRRGQSA